MCSGKYRKYSPFKFHNYYRSICMKKYSVRDLHLSFYIYKESEAIITSTSKGFDVFLLKRYINIHYMSEKKNFCLTFTEKEHKGIRYFYVPLIMHPQNNCFLNQRDYILFSELHPTRSKPVYVQQNCSLDNSFCYAIASIHSRGK